MVQKKRDINVIRTFPEAIALVTRNLQVARRRKNEGKRKR
jgi:hypothetical protein